MSIIIENITYYPTTLAYKVGPQEKRMVVYTTDPGLIEDVINYNSKLLAEKMAEAKLNNLIYEKIIKFLY